MGEKRVIYDVEPRPGGDWAAQRRGTTRAAAVTDSKAEAVLEAKRLAKQEPLAQVVIRKGNGKIQTEHTYGSDPRRTPG